MNELDAIQEQMAWLGIDMSGSQQSDMWTPQGYDMWGQELTDEELAMFAPGWEFWEVVEETTTETPIDVMPEYDMEELKIDIWPMLQGLPKDKLADLVIWMSEQWSLLNDNESENA